MNWSYPLAHDVVTKSGERLRTLHDVRFYMRGLSYDRKQREYWQKVGDWLVKAAAGASAHDLTDQLILALIMDGDLDMEKTPVR